MSRPLVYRYTHFTMDPASERRDLRERGVSFRISRQNAVFIHRADLGRLRRSYQRDGMRAEADWVTAAIKEERRG